MISPSLHPVPIRAAFEPRSRWAIGLTPRSIALLTVGFLGLVPGFWDPHLAYSMLAWDALVLLFSILDGLRLPAPAVPGPTPPLSTPRRRSSLPSKTTAN